MLWLTWYYQLTYVSLHLIPCHEGNGKWPDSACDEQWAEVTTEALNLAVKREKRSMTLYHQWVHWSVLNYYGLAGQTIFYCRQSECTYVWCSGKSNKKLANEFSCKIRKRTVSFLCFKQLMLISNIHNKKTRGRPPHFASAKKSIKNTKYWSILMSFGTFLNLKVT